MPSWPARQGGTILTWNHGAEAVFGYFSGEVIGKHMSLLAPPERLPALVRCAARVLQGKTVSPYEGVCLSKDGRRVPVSVTGSPVLNSAGEVAAMAATLRDISERQRAERKLRESEGLFRGAFAHAPFGMCVCGKDGRLVQVNAAFCRMPGYPEHELPGAPWAKLTHPEDSREGRGSTFAGTDEVPATGVTAGGGAGHLARP
jgi:PAS domain S-box-containing protein